MTGAPAEPARGEAQGQRLQFCLDGAGWFVSYRGRIHTIAADVGRVLAARLPVDVIEAAPSNPASGVWDDATATLRLEGPQWAESVAVSGRPEERLAPVALDPPPASDGWMTEHFTVRAERVDTLVLHAYLPAVEDRPKGYTVRHEGELLAEGQLARGDEEHIVVDCRRLADEFELVVEVEYIEQLSEGDTRRLSFVLSAISRTPRPPEHHPDPAAERLARTLASIGDSLRADRRGDARPRAVVVAWDLTHNPVGRALVLYRLLEPEWDVELVGPQWSHHGDRLWEPVAEEGLRIRTFTATGAADFLTRGLAVATQRRVDLVVASKHRLPSLALAEMIAAHSDAPLVLDIDDDESAFGLEDDDPTGGLFGADARAVQERVAAEFDARTVVSPPLQERFGGTIVRHARAIAPPAGSPVPTALRAEVRKRFAIADDELALFFIGTVRPHKGVAEVVGAMEEADLEARLHIFTTTPEAEVRRQLAGHGDTDRIVVHPACRFSDVPRLLSGADLVVLAQKLDGPVGAHQVPAKIGDAAAVGCPVLVPEGPVFADLAAAGVVETYGPGELADRLVAHHERGRSLARARSLQRRAAAELGWSANAARMNEAIVAAQEAQDTGTPRSSAATAFAASIFTRSRRPEVDPAPSNPAATGFDVTFFWKQRDSGMYGRRSDMVVRHAMAGGHLRRAVQFDAITSTAALFDLAGLAAPRTGRPTQGDLVIENVVARQLGSTVDGVRRECVLYADPIPGSPRGRSVLGTALADPADYADRVVASLAAQGMSPADTIAWVWPVAPGVNEVLERVGFGGVVCDLVDDQRTWPRLSDAEREDLDREYREVLARADLVTTNSAANAEAFAQMAPGGSIMVVGNGAEPAPDVIEPTGLVEAHQRVIGYIGDMQDRVDWSLIEAVAEQFPDHPVVLAGAISPDSPVPGLLARYANLTHLGVVPYERARRLMAELAVALVPHVRTGQTSRMDPLKLYNFAAMGTPVVTTTDVPEQLAAAAVVAAEPAGFIDAVRSQLDTVGVPALPEVLRWSSRVDLLFEAVGAVPALAALRRPGQPGVT